MISVSTVDLEEKNIIYDVGLGGFLDGWTVGHRGFLVEQCSKQDAYYSPAQGVRLGPRKPKKG